MAYCKIQNTNPNILVKPRSGFTLIEIMVATTIFAIAIVMVTASFGMANKWQKQVKANREIIEAGRFAMEKISRDVRTAKKTENNNSVLRITNQDDSVIIYSVDNPVSKILSYQQCSPDLVTCTNASPLIDSTKVFVENNSETDPNQWFVQAASGGNLINVQLFLSPKSNPDKTTKFMTAAAIRNYSQ